jgi:LysR family hydrogen peroxide-inducible transcriptional activator
MNFRDLEYLVAVAKLSHFGNAAEECHVSQSALSLQLQKLESELGVQLFERTSRKVVVTEVGKKVVRRAQELLQGRQELLDATANFIKGLPEAVRIGAIPTIAPYLFTDVHEGFQKLYPDTEPSFDEEVTGRLTKAVAVGDLDAGILATPLEDSLLDELHLFEEPFLLAVPNRHPLAIASHAKPKDLSKEQLLLLKDTHCVREQVMGFCTAHRVRSPGQSVASSIGTLLALVRAGGGVSLIPKMAMEGTHSPGVKCVEISPQPTRQVRVVFRKTSQVGQKVAEAIRDCLRARVEAYGG